MGRCVNGHLGGWHRGNRALIAGAPSGAHCSGLRPPALQAPGEDAPMLHWCCSDCRGDVPRYRAMDGCLPA